MSVTTFDMPGRHSGRDLHDRDQRRRIKSALVGVCASLEHQADPGLPGAKVTARALRRASRAYDQLAEARIGQLLPNRFGKAVLVTASDGRTDA